MPTKKIHPYLLFFNSEVALASLEFQHKTSSVHKIRDSNDVYCFIKDGIRKELLYKEHFYTIYLNRRNSIICYVPISQGGITTTVVEIQHILAGAILSNAHSIILFHNHPSGEKSPSESDIKLTRQIKQACNFHNINLLEHLIITDDDYYSFADNGNI